MDVAVALGVLAMGEEALRRDKVQTVLRPGHGDIEQPALLFNFRRRPGAEVGRDAAVDGVEDENRFPFLSLGGMDCGENEIVFVQERHARPAAGGVRGIERQVRQEALP